MIADKDLDYRFVMLCKKHKDCFDRLVSEVGTIPVQPRFLKMIFDNPGCTQKELGRVLQIKPASVTTGIQKAEALGYVRREYDKNDQRRSNVYLTKLGIDTIGKVDDLITQISETLLNGFNEDEKHILMSYFERMSKNLDLIYGKGETDRND